MFLLNISSFANAMPYVRRQSASDDLTYVVSQSSRPYMYASDYGYDDLYGGTDRVYVLEDNPRTMVNTRTYTQRNYMEDSAAAFLNNYGANSMYGYLSQASNGYGVFGNNNGWNGGSEYFSYFGYKPISG